MTKPSQIILTKILITETIYLIFKLNSMMLFFALQVFQLPLNITELLGDIQPDRGHGHDVINALLQNPALRKTRVKDTGL